MPTPYAFANKYERRTPYSLQYLLNVQRELSRDLVLEAGYLGSVSHHLEMLRAANESLPGTVGSVISRAPYPNFGRIQLVDNGANANYNAVSAKITKRYSQGLTLLASYTYAKSLDVSSGIRVQGDDTLFPSNSYCVKCEYGLSAFDTRQRFVASGLWDLPVGKGKHVNIANRFANAVVGDWQMGSIVTLQSGFPITPNIGGTDRSGTGGGFDRPNATGVSPYLDNPTTDQVVQPRCLHGADGPEPMATSDGIRWSDRAWWRSTSPSTRTSRRRKSSVWNSAGSCSTPPTTRCGPRPTPTPTTPVRSAPSPAPA